MTTAGVQLEEDGGCGLRRNWMEKSGMWPTAELGVTRHESGKSSKK